VNTNVATIIVAFIGLAGTITAALIARPRDAPKPQPEPPSQAHPMVSPPEGGGYLPPPPPPPARTPLKISRSLWWGLAGIFLWLIPILGYIVTLPGLFTAIRDVRSPGTRRYAVAGLILCVTAFTLTIINSAAGAYLVANSISGKHAGPNPVPATSPSSSLSAPPSSSLSAPPDSSAPSRPPSTPGPGNANPGQIPFTPGALLPGSFTDSDGEHFTLSSAGPESCITRSQNATAQNILTQYQCVSQMAGSYVNDAGTILVSVEVMPLADESTAQQVDSAMAQAVDDGDLFSGDLGFWCPTSGTGAVCDSSYFSAATKEGEFTYSYRYFLNADAVWINLSQDTSPSAEDPLQAAADAAELAAGPENYSMQS